MITLVVYYSLNLDNTEYRVIVRETVKTIDMNLSKEERTKDSNLIIEQKETFYRVFLNRWDKWVVLKYVGFGGTETIFIYEGDIDNCVAAIGSFHSVVYHVTRIKEIVS